MAHAKYVLNTSTMRLTQVMVLADKGDALASGSHNGYRQYVFWQDATHLLAWYNSATLANPASTKAYMQGQLLLTNIRDFVWG